MVSTSILFKTKSLWSSLLSGTKTYYINKGISSRRYVKKSKDDCRKALADVTPEVDPFCPDMPCERKSTKKPGILHRIKLRVVEGGTNFGTPFWRLKKEEKEEEPCTVEVEKPVPKALPPPKKEAPTMPEPRHGLQVSILGADTAVGQYVALLLKQCPCIKKLRLYEAKDTSSSECSRDMYKVVQDLQHIDTNCLVQAFTSQCFELDRCLQNTDIVLILESEYANKEMPFDKRFYYQAPMIKRYADAISHECPKAFIIVCATPVDCMVPLIAETLKETGWYDPRKLLGSLAVPEMRATTLAARALSLEPRYTRVPCVGGTEGDALVPLFSKAVEYFDFARHNAELMTEAVRTAPLAVARSECSCMRAADLSEAHALAKLVNKVSHALLCKDIPRVSGFVETDAGQVISPARFLASPVELNGSGIVRNLGLPKMSETEITQVNLALFELNSRMRMVDEWFFALDVLLNREGICKKYDLPAPMTDLELYFMVISLANVTKNVGLAKNWYMEDFYKQLRISQEKSQKSFHLPKHYKRIDDCTIHNIRYLAVNVLLNRHGICKQFDFPAQMNDLELDLMDKALDRVTQCVNIGTCWAREKIHNDFVANGSECRKFFHYPRHYDHLDDCRFHLR